MSSCGAFLPRALPAPHCNAQRLGQVSSSVALCAIVLHTRSQQRGGIADNCISTFLSQVVIASSSSSRRAARP